VVTDSSDSDKTTGIRAYFLALQEQLSASLGFTAVIPHPVGMGDEAEGNWSQMLSGHLLWRYQVVEKCFVVDHCGKVSDEIDLLLCDRQYTTLVFRAGARLFVPAEAVYAVFEVKPRISLAHVDYAAAKVASVRSLCRTSALVVHAGGRHDEPKEPADIIGGLLTTGSRWNPPHWVGRSRALWRRMWAMSALTSAASYTLEGGRPWSTVRRSGLIPAGLMMRWCSSTSDYSPCFSGSGLSRRWTSRCGAPSCGAARTELRGRV